MTIPRVILLGMAIVALVAGALLQGAGLIALVLFLEVIRPADDYATWR